MSSQKIYSDKLNSRGCDICVGCGRCDHISQPVLVVTENTFLKNRLPIDLSNHEGYRLVTIDVGTTTIGMQLHDDKGNVVDSFRSLNPQKKYGSDVISRIKSSSDKRISKELTEMVRYVLHLGLSKFKADITMDEKLFAVVAANTTMSYFLLGYDTSELGVAPFYAKHLDNANILIDDIPCYVFGGLSAFVGGDIFAGMLATDILSASNSNEDDISILVDLGTNGEIVLGNSNKIFATSTAAGPAFEGGANRGVWGSDMVAAISSMLEKQAVDSTGLLSDEYFKKGILVGNIKIYQENIRQIQLAKAAIMAGIDILLSEYGIEYDKISNVYLAGGFGYFLRGEAAVNIGLLPDCFQNKILNCGNTALSGALMEGAKLLKNGFTMTSLKDFSNTKIETLNLATVREFNDKYLSFMDIKKY